MDNERTEYKSGIIILDNVTLSLLLIAYHHPTKLHWCMYCCIIMYDGDFFPVHKISEKKENGRIEREEKNGYAKLWE
jgi:hypothetical protein